MLLVLLIVSRSSATYAQSKKVLISIISVGGLVGMPMCTLYHASNLAEGLHGLCKELAPFGIHVKTLRQALSRLNLSTIFSYFKGI